MTSQEMKNLLKSRKDAAKDNTEAAALLEKCKSQFGDASVSAGLTELQHALMLCSLPLLNVHAHIMRSFLG